MKRVQNYWYGLIAVAVAALILNGCAQRIGDFTIISTKNYEASAKYKMVGRFEGTDRVFFFIAPWGTPSVENAVDEAIEAGKGVYLTNAVLESYSGFFQIGYNVRGDVYALASQSDLLDPNIELYDLNFLNGKLVLQNQTKTLAVERASMN